MADELKIVTIVGARPQFIKAAVLSRAIASLHTHGDGFAVREVMIHTGQHYDENMSDVFFREMEIPKPARNLGVGGGRHGAMTGRMLEAIEQALIEETPDWVLVYGDTNSTVAGALAAAKLHIPVAHVEAGLRSFNRAMPEELNRVLTDHASNVLFAPTQVAVENLLREGLPQERIALVGDVMYDAVLHYRKRAETDSRVLDDLGLESGSFVLATIHRAENTDDPERLRGVMGGLERIAGDGPVVLPLHPRTRAALERTGLLEGVQRALRVIDPLGYLDMLRLSSAARLIATDSGGVQKEAYFHGVPCVTLRDETEWVELIHAGANTLAGSDTSQVYDAYCTMRDRQIGSDGLYGTGNAAGEILRHLIAAQTAQ